ncbi:MULTISPECIES: IS200/IS605 family transposase [unclassified Lentimonas]|uniref:IS200/IS605 family transposase n=1 Tax=unclassified Lentimonas TaxID=2630993 RepID=UPI00138A65C7|nr:MULTISPECIES: IS200/IS605 family transposase [unclassified Lentimonas]
MANTYSSINIHYVFSTKHRDSLIAEEWRGRLWSYMGGVARENGMHPIAIGGVSDHAHLLLSLPTTLSVAKGIQLIKGASSVWINATLPVAGKFAWQAGYGAFSVSVSQLPVIVAYIENQEAHHQVRRFQDEYVSMLQKHAVDYDERYVWD